MAKKFKFVAVTTRTLYAIPDDRYAEELLKEWFEDYPAESYHATRDSSRVGGAKVVLDYKVIDEKEIEKLFPRKASPR